MTLGGTLGTREAGDSRGTTRVLLVEDDDALRRIVAEALGEAGHTVVAAANGREALAALAEARPGVILLDMRMPVMDGWAFARAYRELPGQKAPLVVMTAAQDAPRWAAEVRADACLAKPFDLDALLAAVGRFSTPGSTPHSASGSAPEAAA